MERYPNTPNQTTGPEVYPQAREAATPTGLIDSAQNVGTEAAIDPFAQNPNVAMDAAVGQLFQQAEVSFDETPEGADDDAIDGPRASAGYDGLAIDIGTGEFLSVERIQDEGEAVAGKPRTIITKPVEKGTYNGVAYSQTERYIEGPDGTWHKEVDVDLGPGAETIFGTSKIHEEVPPDMADMRTVHGAIYRPNRVRKLRRGTPQVAGSGASLSERAA